MATAKVTIPKKEYDDLLVSKMRFEYLRELMQDNIFSPPPTKNTSKIVSAFKESGKYNKSFLGSLEKGLKRSEHFKGA